LGSTAPTYVVPWSVISTETRLVRSSRPLPQAPCTWLADPSRAFSTAALSPGKEPLPWAGPSGPPGLPGRPGVSADDGRLSTDSQPDPIVAVPGMAWRPDPAWSPVRFTWVTVAPAGGVKLRSAGAGVTKWMSGYPTWNAGLLAPRAKTCSRSGTPVPPSTSIWIWPTSDLLSFRARLRA